MLDVQAHTVASALLALVRGGNVGLNTPSDADPE